LGPLIAGVVMLPLAIGLVALSVVLPRLLNRWGARTCVLIGLVSTVAAMILIAVLTTAQAGAVSMILPMLLIAAGMCLGIVGLQYVAVSGVTEADAGTASGVQRAADQLGGSAGVAVCVGIGFSSALHSLDPFVVAAALAGAGLVIGAVIARWLPSPSSASVPVDQDG
ncbi:MAG TPA: MFS transporter, partial [Brevibacterium sp.]|nr:MFS transporter [Brevibacterium sp.]